MHQREFQWRAGRKPGSVTAVSFLYSLCHNLFTTLRDMSHDKPECRPNFGAYNKVVRALDTSTGAILADMEEMPSLSKYAPMTT